MRVEFIGEVYKGFDGEGAITVTPGDVVELSEQKAEQVLTDFPSQWRIVVDEKPANVSSAKPKKMEKQSG